MLVLDESGNNLNAPNLRRVSQALQQITDKVGLTMVLACQDLIHQPGFRVGRYSSWCGSQHRTCRTRRPSISRNKATQFSSGPWSNIC